MVYVLASVSPVLVAPFVVLARVACCLAYWAFMVFGAGVSLVSLFCLAAWALVGLDGKAWGNMLTFVGLSLGALFGMYVSVATQERLKDLAARVAEERARRRRMEALGRSMQAAALPPGATDAPFNP